MTPAPIKILGVAGSLREASHSARLLRLAARHAPGDVTFETFDALGDVEPFNEDTEELGEPGGVRAWRTALAQHDAVLIATPEYNGSIPGQLKNALDWASRTATTDAERSNLAGSALYRKPVAVMSASTGQFGGVWARDELHKSLGVQGARVVREPLVSVPAAHQAFDEATGALLDEATELRLVQLVEALAQQVRALRGARLAAASTAK